jgi:hypothetical protein
MITTAYKNYMRDLAQALNNGTSINDTDVTDIFEFEKKIAQVILSYPLCTLCVFSYLVSLDTQRTKCSKFGDNLHDTREFDDTN